MSYNLRHRTEEEAPSANTMSKAAIANIEAKLDLLLKGKEETDSKLSLIIEKMSSTEKEICALKEKVDNLESFANSASKEIQDLRDEVQQKNKQIEDLETIFHKVDDLENRSKRNNLVIWNIPERAEEGKSCEEFVKEFIGNHMNMPNAEAIEIERAHRTPPSRSFGNSMKPRPIHVKFLRYGNRQMVLKNAKLLKDKPYGGEKIFISDDVSKKVREERKWLKNNHLDKVKSTPGVKFAFVPFLVPARIVYKDADDKFHTLYYNSVDKG